MRFEFSFLVITILPILANTNFLFRLYSLLKVFRDITLTLLLLMAASEM